MRIVLGSLLLAFLGGICFNSGLKAQSSEQQDGPLSEQRLEQAIQFIKYNKNDSALIYLEPILEQLINQELIDSPFGLRVQLAKAQVFQQKHLHKEALLLFNELKVKSKAIQEWETYARTCLSLTQLYEKMYRQRRSKENLDLAHLAINQHQLTNLYPSLLVRQTLWNITFGQHPDSVQYYLNKALSVIKDTDTAKPTFRYSLYLIQGRSFVEKADYPEAIEWYKKAVIIAKELNDPVRMSEAWNRVTKSFKGPSINLAEALAYNDSTIHACYQAIAAGHERIYTLHYAYWLRSTFFYRAGQLDSAYYFQRKGLNQELRYVKQQQFDRVAEVDARYRDEQKTKQLEDQAKEIIYEQRIRNLLLAIIMVTLILAIGLAYGLISRRRSIRKLADQNKLIQEQSEQLKSLDAAKSRFFANVSHELRTPLTLILAPIASALKDSKLSNRTHTHLLLARNNGERLNRMINKILDLTRLEAGKLELNPEKIVWYNFLRTIIANFESVANEKNIEFQFQYEDSKTLQVSLDKSKMEIILLNLLSNAFKFTPQNGMVTVFVKEENQYLNIEVHDTGRGIHSADLPHVFDRFYQAKKHTEIAEGGTGIGLALTKEFVDLMKGQITAESEIGKGTTFFVKIPRIEIISQLSTEAVETIKKVDILPPVPRYESTQKTTPETEKTQILLVEDNHDLRNFIAQMLGDYYDVITAENGAEALQRLTADGRRLTESDSETTRPPSTVHRLPSLIISDIMMPIMDGYQLLEKVKTTSELRHIPVIMLTARAGLDDKLKALRIGVDDYLNKPFNEEELLVRIDNLIQNSKNRVQQVEDTAETEKEETALSEKDLVWLKNAEHEVLAGISSFEFSIESLATALTTNRWQLSERLKKITGLTTNQYIQEIRLNHARNLLETGQVESIKKLTYDIGMKDSQYFARLFKKRFGRNPSDFL
jgi:signal transduction histidine kinase/CheY-like chemotaxis protein